ncbi:glycosyltransferase [Paraclostridium bifermentans]|uniref:glycosyltransferase n=1 Tax=Paraclostridium bifermentans TaxID=1490 RepID=UPI00359C2A48
MKKITFQLTNMGIAGGVERVVSIWANYFSQNHDIEIVTENQQTSFYNLEKNIKMGKLNYFSNIKFLPIIRLIIIYKFLKSREDGETIIFNKYIPTTSIYILRKLGLFKNLNLIYFAHSGTSQFINFYKFYQTKQIFNAYDKVICLYEDLNKESKLIKREKIVIICNPTAIKVSEEYKADSKNFLTVGRLSYPKGYDMLIDSWNIVSKELKDWKLLIVGSGELEYELKEKCRELSLENSIEFIPATKNISQYYMDASIFLSSSRYEGLPMVVLEALEAGLPIVSYDIDANKKLVTDNGILVESYNIEKFAEAMIKLAKDKSIRQEMSVNSKRYSKEYDIENIVTSWNEILEV